MTTVQAQPVEMVLANTVERIDILVVDADGQPMDATELVFQLRRIDDSLIYEEDFINAPSRIVNPGTGRYYFPMGDTPLVAGANPETGTCGDFLCVWQVVGPVGSEQVSIVQVVMVVSAYAMSLLPDLRMQIDKAAKMVSEDPSDPCFLGYTDSQLMRFLLNGLTIWNLYEPYPTFMSLDQFPVIYRQGLISAALLVGVRSQELFAIDTDIPQYSAQGTSFVIDHQPRLAAYLSQLAQWLDKIIPISKQKLMRSGTLHVQMGPNYRLTTLLGMSPSGALFRNMFFRA